MIELVPVKKNLPIGFIGLGWMGSNFAARLVQAGWRLQVFDVIPEKRAALETQGAIGAGSTADVVRECDVVFTSLPSSAVFEDVAQQILLPLARAGQVIVDLGTTRLGPTRRIAAELSARGATLLDAPVSGDPRGPVYIFVGGEPGAFQRVEPLLRVLAEPEHLTLGGPSGAGQILKGVNQLCMGVVRAAWLEAVSFAARQGIDLETVEQAVGGTVGWRADLAGVVQQLAGGAGEQQDLKFAELPYFLHAAEEAGMELPLTRALFEFCDPGPRNWRDNMNRPYVSFWYMLHHRQDSSTESSS